ncbi:MAG: hypothetical protein KJ624_03330 [Chloroflexi bacterium]|nr:hypothetical protein [Chloroflexota bacterium]
MKSRDEESLPPGLGARGVAMDFLQAELEAIDDRLSDRAAHLSQSYPGGEHLPPGEEEMTAILLQQKGLICQLIQECSAKRCKQVIYPEVLRQRLAKVEERLAQLDRHAMSTEDYRSKHWQTRVEREVLAQLLGKWLVWLKERGL